jgi:iron(III) transport system permease protein
LPHPDRRRRLFGAGGTFETWIRLWDTVMPRYIWNTVQLSLCVAVSARRRRAPGPHGWSLCAGFPGSRILEIVLALPLAFPAYVLAYAYTDLLDHPGRRTDGAQGGDGVGPARLLVSGDPLSARRRADADLRSLSLCLSARTRGVSAPVADGLFRRAHDGPRAVERLLRVSLPVARPAIAGGTILAMMETIADYGTVAHFGVQTFATGIYQAWFSMGDRAAASQLAFCLMLTALFLVLLEAKQRGGAKQYKAGNRVEAMMAHHLSGWRARPAIIVCLIPVLCGFRHPVGRAVRNGGQVGSEPVRGPLCRIRAELADPCVRRSDTDGHRSGHRRLPGKALSRTCGGPVTKTLSGIGYALPGSVIAVGLLVPFARLDNTIDAFMRENFDISTGLLFTGSIALLVMTYIVRFMAAALSAFDTGMSQIKPNVDAVARTLGSGTLGMLSRVHLPLMRASLLTAVLIVFVDTMKELPATLILRPFNFDTLAVQAHRLASDERLAQAAVPSLVIVAFGLLPVILLCRTIAQTQQTRPPCRKRARQRSWQPGSVRRRDIHADLPAFSVRVRSQRRRDGWRST